MSRFKKAIKLKQLESTLSEHPLRELDEQVKKDYVKGLVSVALEDENFSQEEKAYILSMMRTIGLDVALLEEFTTFANDCEEEELLEFMDRLKAFDEDIKINFMIEVVVIAFRDGEFDESEKEIFFDYLDMLELKDKKDLIKWTALAVINKDTDLSLSLYTAKKEFFEKYAYMFDIDIKKELEELYNWKWEFSVIRGTLFGCNDRAASTPVSVRQFCVFINSKIISGEIIQLENTMRFQTPSDTVIIESLEKTNLDYDDMLGLLKYDSKIKNNNYRGITAYYKTDYYRSSVPDVFSSWIKDKLNINVLPLEISDNQRGEIKISSSSVDLLTSDPEAVRIYRSYKEREKYKVDKIYDDFECELKTEINTLHVQDKPSLLSPNVSYAFRLMRNINKDNE
jgi:uncharacterized tellurite resistance protein B-like protein